MFEEKRYHPIDNETSSTLLIGMYERFRSPTEEEKRSSKRKEEPKDFEHFVARIMEKCLGCRTEVTQHSGDLGVDIRHYHPKGLILGQVKCYAPHNKVDHEPVAILHSNMVREKAVNGYVVTTSEFTTQARSFNRSDMGIQLINGIELVEYWQGKRQSWVRTEDPKGFLEWLFSIR